MTSAFPNAAVLGLSLRSFSRPPRRLNTSHRSARHAQPVVFVVPRGSTSTSTSMSTSTSSSAASSSSAAVASVSASVSARASLFFFGTPSSPSPASPTDARERPPNAALGGPSRRGKRVFFLFLDVAPTPFSSAASTTKTSRAFLFFRCIDVAATFVVSRRSGAEGGAFSLTLAAASACSSSRSRAATAAKADGREKLSTSVSSSRPFFCPSAETASSVAPPLVAVSSTRRITAARRIAGSALLLPPRVAPDGSRAMRSRTARSNASNDSDVTPSSRAKRAFLRSRARSAPSAMASRTSRVDMARASRRPSAHTSAFHAPATTAAAHEGEGCFTHAFSARPFTSSANAGENVPAAVVGSDIPSGGNNVERSASHELDASSSSAVSISTAGGTWSAAREAGRLAEGTGPAGAGAGSAITPARGDLASDVSTKD